MDLIRDYWHKYGFIGIPALWLTLSFIVNLLLRIRTASEWVNRLKQNKTIALIWDTLLGVFGVDVEKAVANFKTYADRRAQEEREKALKAMDGITKKLIESTQEQPK